MTSIEEAREQLRLHCSPLCRSVVMKTGDARGHILSGPVPSGRPLPSFSHSAMDGYLVHRTDLKSGQRRFGLEGECSAGSSPPSELPKGRALRIYTGAPLPPGDLVVIVQEKTREEKGSVVLEITDLPEGRNIRYLGEEIEEGELLFGEGHRIGPASIGALTMAGIREVLVYREPQVGILSTGDELVATDQEPGPGRIPDSNRPMIEALVEEGGFSVTRLERVPDERKTLFSTLQRMLYECDMVITLGGVSVGARDLMAEAFERLAVRTVFHKVDQKPGKPVFFGMFEHVPVLGLPGNPAAALVCAYEYGMPALRMMAGDPDPWPRRLSLPLAERYAQKPGRPRFLKAFAEDGVVHVLEGQGSGQLSSFARANALVFLPADRSVWEAGEEVELHFLSQC